MLANLPKELADQGLEYACTDIGNKDRFVRDHKGKVLHIKEMDAWAIWDGSRWQVDNNAAHRLGWQTVRSIYDEAKNCANGQGQRMLSKWALQSQAEAKIRSMLSLSKHALSVSMAEFDTDPYVLNCENGLVDLKSGQLQERTSQDLVMKIANAKFSPDAKCDRWKQFISEIFCGDEELMAWMQKYLGYTISGSVKEEYFLILYGRGRNGKGKLCETLLSVLGDYAKTTDFDMFLSADNGVRKMEAMGSLQGVRFATASETDSTKKWSEALIKRVTGGDTLQGAKLYGQRYEFAPSHKLFFQVNHLPGFKDASVGFKSRLCVVPFDAEFAGEKQDKDLKDQLLAERDGILAWLVEGARLYFSEGLGDRPQAIQRATNQYIEDNDLLSQFLAEVCIHNPERTVSSGKLYEAYQAWCQKNGHQAPVGQKFFKDGMAERGVAWKKTKSGNVFVGYTLRDQPTFLDLARMTGTDEMEMKGQYWGPPPGAI